MEIKEILNFEFGNKGLSPKHKTTFFNQFSSFQSSGIPLYDCLDLVTLPKKLEKKFKDKILSQLLEGRSLAEGLRHTNLFSDLDTNMISFGEQTGQIPSILNELGTYYERISDRKKKVVQALSYPIFVLISAFGAVAFLLAFVVPIFKGVFQQFGGELPKITQIVLAASEGFGQHWLLVILILSILFSLIVWAIKTPQVKSLVDNFLIKLPFISNWIKDGNNNRIFFCLILGEKSDVPFSQSIQLIKKVLNNTWYISQVEALEELIFSGKSIHKAIGTINILNSSEIKIIKAGEESGNLAMSYNQILKSISNREDKRIHTLTSFLEPALIVFVGGLIGLVLVAMYLPMFEVSNLIN